MAPSYRLPAARSLERRRDEEREGKEGKTDHSRGREGGGVEVVCGTRIKHWEMVPCEKMADQKSWQVSLIFFFLHSSAFSLPLCLLKALQSERPPETAGDLPFIHISFLSFSPLPALHVFISLAISHNFCPAIHFSPPGTPVHDDLSLLFVTHRREVIAPGLSVPSLSDCTQLFFWLSLIRATYDDCKSCCRWTARCIVWCKNMLMC